MTAARTTDRKAVCLPLAAVLLVLALASLACRGIETGVTRIERDGALYSLSLDGERIVRFAVPELGAAGLPRVEIGEPEDGWRRVRLVWEVPAAIAQDELAVRFDVGFEPELWWAPHLAPEEGYVVGQHVFRSPALIAAGGPRVLAVVPDLDLVGARPESPWFLDYDAPGRRMWLGLVRTDVPEHVLFKKAPGLAFAPGKVELAFFVAAYIDPKAVKDPWARTSAFLWTRWGRPLYEKGEPIPGPLHSYVRRTYDWAFGGWGPFVWQEFDLGRPPGRRAAVHRQRLAVAQLPRPVVPARVPVDLEPGLVLVPAERIGALPLRAGDDRRGAPGQGAPDERAGPGRSDDATGSSRPSSGPRTTRSSIDGKKLRRPRAWSEARWSNSDRTPLEHGITANWYHVLDMSVTALAMLRWYDELEKDPRLARIRPHLRRAAAPRCRTRAASSPAGSIPRRRRPAR